MAPAADATWAVHYADGTACASDDAAHPAFVPDAGEVPFRAVDWARAVRLTVRWPDRDTAVPIPPAPDGLAWSLRCRTFVRLRPDGPDGAADRDPPAVRVYLLVLSAAGAPVDACSTREVVWLFPDGAARTTAALWDAEASAHAERLLTAAAAAPAEA